MGVSTSLKALKCDDDGVGGSYLHADPRIICWEGEHIPLAVGGLVGVLLYMVCVPAGYCWVLFWLLPKSGRKTPLAKAFAFIYGRFEPRLWWWELIQIARKVRVRGRPPCVCSLARVHPCRLYAPTLRSRTIAASAPPGRVLHVAVRRWSLWWWPSSARGGPSSRASARSWRSSSSSCQTCSATRTPRRCTTSSRSSSPCEPPPCTAPVIRSGAHICHARAAHAYHIRAISCHRTRAPTARALTFL